MKNINQLWTAQNIVIPLTEFQVKERIAVIKALNFIGQEFIRNARLSGDYTDRTGNLRSSIGYAIYENGKELNSVFEIARNDEGEQGVKSGKDLAKEKVSKNGIALIVTAGMDYALYVEAKGFNVLTLFAPSEGKVKRDLQKLLKYVG